MLAACRTHDAPPAAGTPHRVLSPQAAALFLRGDSLYKRDFDSARVVLDSAIDIARRDADSVTLARALTMRGNAAWRLGRYDDARRIGEEGLALKRRIGLDGELSKSYAGLGLLEQARGRLDTAHRLFALGLAAAIAARDSEYVVKSHNNLGLLLTDLGEFDRARSELDTARTVAAARGDGRVETSAAINLGKLELEIGDPTAALRWLRGARARSAALHYFVGEENALGQIARAYAALGEPELAISYTDSALAIAREHELEEPETDDLHQMADLYLSAGQHKPALGLLSQARALADSLGMLTKLAHISLAQAHAYAALGNLRVARARATALVTRLRREGARGDELEAELYAAELAQRAGDRAGAEARLDTAATVAASLGTSLARVRLALARARVLDVRGTSADVGPVLASIGRDSLFLTAEEQTERDALLARAQLRLGVVDSAIVAGRRAVAGAERIRARLATGELRAGYMSTRAAVYADLVMALLRKGEVDEAFRVADAARGRSLTERLGAESRSLRSSRRSADAAELRQLLARIELLTARLRATDSSRTRDRGPADLALADTLARQLTDARRQYETLVVRVARNEPAASVLGATTVGASEVRRSLEAGEALVEFFTTTDRLLTFVVTHDGVRWTESAVGEDDLAERVRSARSAIASRAPGAEAPLRGLYDRLIAPLERSGMLTGARRLVVVPHGALAYLPIDALVHATPSGERYLVEDYSILMLASASALPLLRGRPTRGTNEQASVLAPLPAELPATRQEASAVVRASGARSWIGAAATERVLREALTRGGVVHVASHGAYEGRSPMFSGIQLARSSNRLDSDDDGRLQTHEVLSMTVRSPLVFLSGCETALGPAWGTSFERSDDYVTLAGAFLFAGAQNVVATLWPIDDASAADLAGRFSRALTTASPAEALATAQRELIRGGKYRHPYYWAAYVVSGSGLIR